jgi:DmsE family decaheme c-type cytochrome
VPKPSAARRHWAGVVAVAALLAACATLQWKPIGPRRVAAVPGATSVGEEECQSCHDEVEGHEKIASYHGRCETCHGPGSLHAESEEPKDIRFPSSADCLACHGVGHDTHLQWGTGQHARAGLLCSDCHNPHATEKYHLRHFAQAGFPDVDAASALCIECHRDVEAQFTWPSHHPVREGAMSCLGCHDPHEDRRVAGGDANERCAECHQDVMGPWVFEHPPAVESCTLCHSPHGAVVPDLLATTQPVICLSCHPIADLWHHDIPGTGIPGNRTIDTDFPNPTADPGQAVTMQEAMTFLRRCTDCHGSIHGSYTDAYLRH